MVIVIFEAIKTLCSNNFLVLLYLRIPTINKEKYIIQ